MDHHRSRRRSSGRRSFLLGAAVALALSTATAATAAAVEAADLRFRLNPALARVHARDPEAAARLLGELDRILREPPPPAGRPQSRQVRRPELDGLLAENPLLQEAYRIDPKSALTQLREIVQIGGGK
jgi:hypothetical protein